MSNLRKAIILAAFIILLEFLVLVPIELALKH